MRVGQCEVELRGRKDDVMDVIENRLAGIVDKVTVALGATRQRGGKGHKQEATEYPVIQDKGSCSQAIIDLLSTDWGKDPRTSRELLEGMRANGVLYPKTTLSGVLKWLVGKGKLRRWKRGRSYVYMLRRGGD